MKRAWQLEIRVDGEWRVVARDRDWDWQDLIVHVVRQVGVPVYRLVEGTSGLNGRSNGAVRYPRAPWRWVRQQRPPAPACAAGPGRGIALEGQGGSK